MNKLLTCLAIVLMVAPLFSQSEVELKSSDHKKLGKPFADWFDAILDGDSAEASEAMMELDKVARGIDKKLKGRSSLSLVADWTEVLSSGRNYAESGKNIDGDAIKKGSIQDIDTAGWGLVSVWLPAKYEPKKVNYPVILLVCDKPAQTIELLPGVVKEGAIVLAPHIEKLTVENLMEEEGKQLFLTPIGRASRDFRTDRAKLFVVAEGERGIDFSSRYVALLPHFFAGLATVAGSCGEFPGKANLALVESGEHVDMAAASEWCMTAAARNPYPSSFEYEFTTPWNGRAYWVQALKFESPDALPEGKIARMKIAVERSTNTITIDSEFIEKVQLRLNDVIVDLDQPITIIRNGAVYTFQASRSIGTMLEIFLSSVDDTIFPSLIRSVDVPKVEAEDVGTEKGGK